MKFVHRPTHFRVEQFPADLPLCFGTAAATRSSGNGISQDATVLLSNGASVAGVVSDGCFGTAAAIGQATFSSNEIGAKVVAMAAATELIELSHLTTREFPDKGNESISKRLLTRLEQLATLLCGDRSMSFDSVVEDFCTATVVAFLITRHYYVVLHCGDGYVALNDNWQSLADDEGMYLANYLRRNLPGEEATSLRWPALRTVASGPLDSLDSLVIASDGVGDLVRSGSALLDDLKPIGTQPGHVFNAARTLQRVNAAWRGDNKELVDDAAFVIGCRARGGERGAS